MNQDIILIRSIASEFFKRKYKSLLLVFIIVTALSVGLLIWLIGMSLWWLLAAIPVFLWTVLGTLLLIIGRIVISLIKPQVSKQQTSAVSEFVDKFERITENIQTPPFIILFRVIRDAVWPRNRTTFIESMAKDSTTLHKDFIELQRKFKT